MMWWSVVGVVSCEGGGLLCLCVCVCGGGGGAVVRVVVCSVCVCVWGGGGGVCCGNGLL